MATETIREFLVSLGFRVDQQGLKKFSDGLGQATKSVFKLAAAIESTAVLVAAGIARFASNLEQLYFSAQRTGSSATQLKALDLAARSLGASSGEAVHAVEALAMAFRTNPGNIALTTSLLGRLGLTLKRNADGGIDSADALIKLSQVFRQMPFYQAAQFAQQLGISNELLFQLTNGDLAGKTADEMKKLGQNGFDSAAKKSHDLMDQLRDLGAQFEKIGAQVENAFAGKLIGYLKQLNTWLENNPAAAQKFIDAIGLIIKSAEWLGEKLTWVIDKLKDLDKATDGWSTKLLALALVLKVTGASSIIGGVLSLAGALLRVTGAAGLASTAIGGLMTVAGPLMGLAGAGAIGYGVGSLIGMGIDKLLQSATGDKNQSLGGWLYDITHRDEHVKQFFSDRGYSSAATAGILANLESESHLSASAEGDHGTAYGLAQWHPDRQLDFKRLFGHDIRNSNFDEQLQFIDWELKNHPEYGLAMLRAAKSNDAAARAFSNYYERPADAAGAADKRGALASTISSQTTIHVNGAGDAQSVADRVAAQQRRVNAEMARNLAPAVQ